MPVVADKATLDEEFESEVVARCLRDATFMRHAAPVLEVHHIGSPQLSWLWGVLRETWLAFSEVPGGKAIAARAARDFPDDARRVIHLRAVAELYKRETKSARSSLEEIRRFVRLAHLHDAMLVAAKSLKESDPDAAEQAVRKALAIAPKERNYQVSRWMEEWDVRLAESRHRAEHPEEMRAIPTGLRPLDRALSGGVTPGEVAIVMATTNKGKSIFLNNIGWHAVARGFRVVHVTTEMRADQVGRRYDSRFTLTPYDKFKRFDFTVDELRMLDKRVARWRKRLEKKLAIIAVPTRRADMLVVRDAVNEAAAEMDGVDMVIVDSPDHMMSTLRHKEIRIDQAEVYWDFKAMCQELNVVGWASTQAGREWADKVAKAEAASETYDKARIADLMLTLNTPDKRKKKGAKVDVDDGAVETDVPEAPALEAFLAKLRDGRSKMRIPLSSDLSRMLIKAAEEDDAEEDMAAAA